jgi:hypothetical protein
MCYTIDITSPLSLVLAFSWYSRAAAHAHIDSRKEHDTTLCQCSGRSFAIG